MSTIANLEKRLEQLEKIETAQKVVVWYHGLVDWTREAAFRNARVPLDYPNVEIINIIIEPVGETAPPAASLPENDKFQSNNHMIKNSI